MKFAQRRETLQLMRIRWRLSSFWLVFLLACTISSQRWATAQAAPLFRLERILLTLFPQYPSYATDINDAGYVVANQSLPREYSAQWAGHLWKNGQASEKNFGYGLRINNKNQVIWTRSGNNNDTRGIIWDSNQEVLLGDLPGGQDWVAPAVLTDTGESYGWSLGENNRMIAVGWTQTGAVYDLGIDVTGYEASRATDANNQGQVAGYNSTFSGQSPKYRGWVWQNGRVELLSDRHGDLGPRSIANAINNIGQVVGLYVEENSGKAVAHPAIWKDGPPTLLSPLAGFDDGYIDVINDRGFAVGISDKEGYGNHQVTLWEPTGKAHALESVVDELYGWKFDQVFAINNHNQIVGVAIDPQGVQRGYVLTPIPEPAAALLFAGAGTMLGLRRPASRRIVRWTC
jgi:hypothetical protein